MSNVYVHIANAKIDTDDTLEGFLWLQSSPLSPTDTGSWVRIWTKLIIEDAAPGAKQAQGLLKRQQSSRMGGA